MTLAREDRSNGLSIIDKQRPPRSLDRLKAFCECLCRFTGTLRGHVKLEHFAVADRQYFDGALEIEAAIDGRVV
jgi:hypothetical protein